jgi:hypothetical protein
VLAQHTLSHIFSVRPQDRATYFKALLEITDLDDVRNDIAALTEQLKLPDDPLLAKFDNCAAVPALKPSWAEILRRIPDVDGLTAKISDAARALIKGTRERVPYTLDDQLGLGALLGHRYPTSWT